MKKSEAPKNYRLFDCYRIQESNVRVYAPMPENAIAGNESVEEQGAIVEMLITSFEDRISDNK